MRRLTWVPIAAATLAACRDPTQVDVVLRTDVACADLLGVEVTVGATPQSVETRAPGASTQECSSGSIGNVVLVPQDADDAAFCLRVVAGFDKPVEDCRTEEDFTGRGPNGEGCIEAKRSLSFIPHTPLMLPIDLRESCVGVSCLVDETCVRGTCVRATIDCTEGEACDETALDGAGGAGAQGGAGGAGGAGATGGGGTGGTGGQGGDGVVAVAAGHQSTCVRMASGKIVCWGANNFGKLGNGTTDDATMDPGFEPLPAAALGPPAIGVSHGCIVTTDNSVYCAGQDVVEQLGNGPGEAPSQVPTQTLVTRDLGFVEAGATHTVALSGAGEIFCWGDNTSKQCAQANLTYVAAPTSLGFPGVWKTVSAGAAHTCAIDSLDRVFCWGDNSASQTAQSGGPATALPAQVQLAGMQPLLATEVSAGGQHTCAVSQGQVLCWGKNDMQQICHSMATTESAIPNPCPIQTPVSHVGASVNGACALDQDDGVHCWGHASLVDAQAVGWYGVPTPVYDNAQQISVGTDHACALLHGGEVVCWGRNDNGQVNGTSMPSEILPPTQVFGP